MTIGVTRGEMGFRDTGLGWIQTILKDRKYINSWELGYYSILRSFRTFVSTVGLSFKVQMFKKGHFFSIVTSCDRKMSRDGVKEKLKQTQKLTKRASKI